MTPKDIFVFYRCFSALSMNINFQDITTIHPSFSASHI